MCRVWVMFQCSWRKSWMIEVVEKSMCQTVLEKSLGSFFSGQSMHLQKTATKAEAIPKWAQEHIIIWEPRSKVPYL